jgi:GATA-binding protein
LKQSNTNTNNAGSSVPSGVAQLRKSWDQAPTNAANTVQVDHPDATNLNDFIFSAELGMSPSPELSEKEAGKSAGAVTSAIATDMPKESATQFAVPQSVPVPHHNPQRHVRKTSIDEKRVSYYFFGCYL